MTECAEVLGKSYPSSGRPSNIAVTNDKDRSAFLKRQGFFRLAWRPANYTQEKAWKEFTRKNPRTNFHYWR